MVAIFEYVVNHGGIKFTFVPKQWNCICHAILSNVASKIWFPADSDAICKICPPMYYFVT